jgi:hypothetical protein
MNHFITPPQWLTPEANFTISDAPNEWSHAPEIGKRLLLEYRKWLADTTISRLQPDQQTDKTQSYLRDAFRRTPIVYTHTIGISFRVNRTDFANAVPQPLAYQQGYLSYEYNPSNKQFSIIVDGQQTQIEVNLEENTCHSLVVTSNLQKNNMAIFGPESKSYQGIYVDGLLVSQLTYRNPLLSKASPSNALVVNTDEKSGLYMPPGARPVISSRVLDGDTISTQLHPELLNSCEKSQAGLQTK